MNEQNNYQTPKPVSGLAVTGFVFSLLFFIPLLPLIGVILGAVALGTMGDSKRGKGLAIAAIPTGLLTVFMMQGILAAVAIPAFINYMRRAKTTEATLVIDAFQDSLDTYANNQNPPAFPVATTQWIPANSCCDGSGGDKCAPADYVWSGSPWDELDFKPDHLTYYRLMYNSEDGQTAQLTVHGDLDCDDKNSEFGLSARIENGEPVFDILEKIDPLE